MGAPSYMRSVVDRNVVMRLMTKLHTAEAVSRPDGQNVSYCLKGIITKTRCSSIF